MAWHDQPKLRNHPAVLAYIDDLEPAQRAHVTTMRELVQSMDPDVVECIAWGIPFWFRRGPLCYASAAKTHVTLGIARGVEINDTTGLLRGTGKSPLRKTILTLHQSFPEAAARDWLTQALQLDERDEEEC